MLDHEVHQVWIWDIYLIEAHNLHSIALQVWIWDIHFIGTHNWWGGSASNEQMSMEHFKYSMLKG